jgi:hypothetical protein
MSNLHLVGETTTEPEQTQITTPNADETTTEATATTEEPKKRRRRNGGGGGRKPAELKPKDLAKVVFGGNGSVPPDIELMERFTSLYEDAKVLFAQARQIK